MRRFLLTTSLILMGVSVFAQTEIHDGRITGVIPMGAQEVVAVHDLQTNCIYKSEMHTKGSFMQGEQVKLSFPLSSMERGEIIKPSLPDVVYIHDRGCKASNKPNQGNSGENPQNNGYSPCDVGNCEIVLDDGGVKENLKGYAIGLAFLAQDNNFKSLVHNEVSKEFDGDYNALLNTISDEYLKELGGNLVSQVNYKAARYGVRINAKFNNRFCNAEGDKFYPQVFIPDFESIDKTQKPKVAYYLGDDLPTAEAYYVDDFGNLQSIILSESDLGSDNVWVVSINERVSQGGQFPPVAIYNLPGVCGNGICEAGCGENYITCPDDCPPPVNPPSNNGNIFNFRINQIQVHDSKDRKWAGKPEIRYSKALYNDGHIGFGGNQVTNKTLHNVTNSEVNDILAYCGGDGDCFGSSNLNWIAINKIIQTGWDRTVYDNIGILIYEYDFGAIKRTIVPQGALIIDYSDDDIKDNDSHYGDSRDVDTDVNGYTQLELEFIQAQGNSECSPLKGYPYAMLKFSAPYNHIGTVNLNRYDESALNCSPYVYDYSGFVLDPNCTSCTGYEDEAYYYFNNGLNIEYEIYQ